MRDLRRFLKRFRNLVTRRRNDERLKEEIEEHIALQTAEYMKSGTAARGGAPASVAEVWRSRGD
jgi:hypothetical protein